MRCLSSIETVTTSVVPAVPLKKCLGEFDEYFDTSMFIPSALTLSTMYRPLSIGLLAPVIFNTSPSLLIWPNLVGVLEFAKKKFEDSVILALKIVSLKLEK